MARTAALTAGPAALLAWCWLRLERPHAGLGTAFWLIVLGIAPALLPRLRWRLVALAGTCVFALHTALGVWVAHPGRVLTRFGGGFLDFYDVRLPFAADAHLRMEGVILVALFASCAVVALAVAARRPVLAATSLLVAAGWPATLLTGSDDLNRGVALLALMLTLVLGLGERLRPRRVIVAVALGAAVSLAAFAASSSSAVASGQVLHWQGWDFYTKPEKPVGVEYVWNSDYRGLHFPKKVTVVLRIKAPPRRTYWRATTLDEFDRGNWYEDAHPIAPTQRDGRSELLQDVELPIAARDRSRWVRQVVTVGALRDNHLIGASVPVAYQSATHVPDYAEGGVATLQTEALQPGERYTVWSYEAQPTPRQLAKVEPRYPELLRTVDLSVAPHVVAPPFGKPGRERRLDSIFRGSYIAQQYRAVYDVAKRVVGEPPNPYAAALELEGWFRSGAFRYDEHPPPTPGEPPLAAFVLRTHRGYCQHFAGAMALMLRYLGIPARVAAGFTTGVYDRDKHEWLVTDHDAHTWVEAWFPRYGWLPFDPTPGRGSLDGSYTLSSPRFDLTDGLFAVAASHLKRSGPFNLRKLRDAANAKNTSSAASRGAQKRVATNGSGIGALLELLVLVGAAVVLMVVVAKLVVRKRRYLTRDPRKLGGACVRELADFVADQGAMVPSSSTLRELSSIVERELGPSPGAFAGAASEALYGPPADARAAARDARRELRVLRQELRASLTRLERALGLVSLRSLGLTG
jgi:transglutaminase-like putative cysteine protease